MKRIISAAVIAATLILSLAACGGTSGSRDVNVEDVYNDIAAAVTLPDFISLSESDVSEYISVDTADFKQMLIKISAESISADQIVCCEAVSSEAADKIEAAFSVYLESVKKSFENYLPAEYAKIKDTTVKRNGNYVYYAVSSDINAVNAVFAKYFS